MINFRTLGALAGKLRPALRTRVVLPVIVIMLVGAAAPTTLRAIGPNVAIRGLEDGALISKAALQELSVAITSSDPSTLGEITLELDGTKIEPRRAGDRLVFTPSHLDEGEHQLSASLSGALPFSGMTVTRSFTVDTTPPKLDLPSSVEASIAKPVTLRGSVDGATAVTAEGKAVGVSKGAFAVRFPRPPGSVKVVATDASGNRAEKKVRVVVDHPPMQAVHMSAISWASDELREPILEMARQGRINAVEVDIKGESGQIGYDSDVPLAEKIGADKGYYDARKMIKKLHSLGVRVVGRLVCFRDPVLAQASWEGGHKDRVVQTPSGGAYGAGSSYGEMTFTNPANPAVRQYNIDLAVEAAKLGFDDILYDYVRRPEGPASSMEFPGLKGSPSEAITSFVAATQEKIRPHGAFLGLSVFGVAINRPKQMAQNIPALAKHSDYISPMVYPSHWGPGEYGVSDPNSQPYKIVKRSLADYVETVEGTDAEVIPWLQDFSLGVTYGPDEVRAQIEAAKELGLDSFLLWNAGVRYHSEALTPDKAAG